MKKRQRKVDFRSIQEKTLEELLGLDWPEPKFESHVATNVHRLRNVPIKQYHLRDLRLMISQGIALPYLVPIALEHLENHPFAEAEFYPGDLFHSILSIDEKYWLMHKDSLRYLRKCLHTASLRIRKSVVSEELKTKINDAISRFGTG